jgi:hypothetical protein
MVLDASGSFRHAAMASGAPCGTWLSKPIFAKP